MKRWHQGHSLGAGVLVGVAIAGNVWLVFALGLAVGIALAYARQTAQWFAGAWEAHRRNKATWGTRKVSAYAAGPEPVYRVPRPPKSSQDASGIPY